MDATDPPIRDHRAVDEPSSADHDGDREAHGRTVPDRPHPTVAAEAEAEAEARAMVNRAVVVVERMRNAVRGRA